MKTLRRSFLGAMAVVLVSTTGILHATDDNLLWLEDTRGERALDWARETTRVTREELGKLPSRAVISTELESLLKQAPPEADQHVVGQRLVRVLRDAEHPHGLLQTSSRNPQGLATSWKTVLDVAALREREGVPFELQVMSFGSNCLAPEYARCLIRLSPGGGDEVEIREFDLDSGRFVDGGFRVPRSRAFAEWLDADTILIEHTVGDSPRTMAGWPATSRIWKRGTALADAKPVYQAKSTDSLVQLMSAGTPEHRQVVLGKAITYASFDISLVDAGGNVRTLPIPETMKAFGALGASTHHVFFQLAEAASIEGRTYPAEALLAYDIDENTPEGKRASLVYAPADGEFLDLMVGGLAAVGEDVYVVVNRDLQQRVISAHPEADGSWQTREVMQVPAGQSVTLRADTLDASDLVATISGFVTPRSQYILHADGHRQLLAQDTPIIDGSRYTTEIGSTLSRDGTSIDYYLLKPRTGTADPLPMLMTGYGAFGVSVRPAYFDANVGGPALKLWLERGGALAIPAIRGGGERGEAWHQAAVRDKRQNSYDDFIAVTEHLVKTGVAAPGHIGAFGSSNGGLLTAVLGTERPDLYSALVVDAPVTDMLRYTLQGIGGGMTTEYGDPEDPEMAKAILKYSPFQNIHSGTDYPPFMVTISTEDDRVGPGHARRFAHRLADVGAPVYFYEDEEGGHGVSDAFRNPELMSMRMSFLIDTLMPKSP